MTTNLRKLAIATVALLALTGSSPAFVGDDTVEWPVRYRVRVLARFEGRSWHESDDWDDEGWHDERARKLETDVLSFDGPDTYHWEKPLAGGLLLDGTYSDNGTGSLLLEPDTSDHFALQRGRFPFIRKPGAVRAEARFAKVSPSLASISGSSRYNIKRTLLDYYQGRVYVRIRGKRI
jgi:hypothetical protein